MAKIPTKNSIKKRTIEDMKSLGIYKEQYRDIINVYVDTYYSYLKVQEEFEKSGMEFETETAAGNPKKSAVADSLEKLRKDIIAYSDRLCLNPKSIENVTANTTKKSKLETALDTIGAASG